MRMKKFGQWSAPDGWKKIRTIDLHTEGEPLRVIVGGYPELKGKTILERRRYARDHLDFYRTALMWEPRGHADMYGCVVMPPVTDEADVGVLFLHNEGYSSMCGHGIIGLAKALLETGVLPIREPETVVKIDTPAGLITAYARIEGGGVGAVRFHNVPSFAVALDESIDAPELGNVKYDLAFGGAFYAYVQARHIDLKCSADQVEEIIRKGMMIKKAIMRSRAIIHPFEDDLGFLYGTIFIAAPLNEAANSRNVCVFAEKQVDRSPTGTGVSGLLAIHFARMEIALNEPLVVESIIGTRFTGRIVNVTDFDKYQAVIPEIEGRAYITGCNEFLIDPNDPLKKGFKLG